MNSKQEILKEIRKAISEDKNNIFLDLDYPNNTNENWIWIGTKSIGSLGPIYDDCHYEFIFNDNNMLSLEIHIDEKRNQDWFKNIKLPDFLKLSKWNVENGRIVFKKDSYKININDDDDKTIVEKALRLLYLMYDSIGDELEEILRIHQNPIPELSSKNNHFVKKRHYKAISEKTAKDIDIKHGKIQQKLMEELKSMYKNLKPEWGFKNLPYRIDLLGLTDNGYDIYEIKPYETAMACIREALGQILFYDALMSKKYEIRKMIIVGPEEMTPFEEKYFSDMKALFNSSVILEYQPCKID